jgi:hypothetical protein
MGLLVVGALAGILLSLAWFAPSQGYPGYISQPYFNQAVNSRPVEPGPKASQPHAALAKAPPKHAMASNRKKKRSPVKLARRTPARPAPRVAASDRPASDHPVEVQDDVMDKAKTAIAAKLEEPETAEFGDMKRAMRKNMFGEPVDTICGHVSGKSAAGEQSAEKPFLYLVKEDDAYVVDGKTNTAASIAYRNICN